MDDDPPLGTGEGVGVRQRHDPFGDGVDKASVDMGKGLSQLDLAEYAPGRQQHQIGPENRKRVGWAHGPALVQQVADLCGRRPIMQCCQYLGELAENIAQDRRGDIWRYCQFAQGRARHTTGQGPAQVLATAIGEQRRMGHALGQRVDQLGCPYQAVAVGAPADLQEGAANVPYIVGRARRKTDVRWELHGQVTRKPVEPGLAASGP